MQAERSQFGPVETKRFREQRVNEHVAEVRRAIHDGEWSVALATTWR